MSTALESIDTESETGLQGREEGRTRQLGLLGTEFQFRKTKKAMGLGCVTVAQRCTTHLKMAKVVVTD